MRARQTGNRGSAALGYIGASLLVLLAFGGWYATWRHYNHNMPTPACTAANLRLSVGVTSGSAGVVHTHLAVVNQGNAGCTLVGFPAVFLTDANNNPIGSGAGLSTLNAMQTVTLDPGSAAHIAVAFPDHDNFGTSGVCSSASTNVELYLPATSANMSVPLVEYNCPGFTTTAFEPGQ